MIKQVFISAAAIVLLSASSAAQNKPASAPAVRSGSYVLDKDHAKIVWATSHFGFSTYYGEFTKFDARLNLDQAKPQQSRLDVTVQTGSVSTNNDKMEAHLRSADFFDAEKHQTATFRSTQITLTSPTTAKVTGDFTLLGVTKPLTLAVRFNQAGENPVSKMYTAGFTAEGTVKRSDWGMKTYAPAIGDEVKLIIEGEFNPAS